MGKSIEQKYSDVNHRIIKKSVKRDKTIKKSSRDLLPAKRKLPSIEDNDQPNVKLCRAENVNFQEKPKVDNLPRITIKKQIEINCEVYAVQTCDGVRLQIKEKSRDLFFHDELSDNYENYINKDFAFQILDEISLEGLDGITIEGNTENVTDKLSKTFLLAFWKRLAIGMEKMVNIREDLKQYIWQFICSKKNLQFFKLPEPRGILDIYDRSKYIDAEIGVVVELVSYYLR